MNAPTIPDLIAYARGQGLTLTVSGGLLQVTAPQGAEGITATLHRHETAVIAALEEESMPKIVPALLETAPPAVEQVDISDPLKFLAHVQARITAAETDRDAWETLAQEETERANKAQKRITGLEADLINAEARADDLEAENRSLRTRLDHVGPQLNELAQIKAAFRAALTLDGGNSR
ncbi:hypothetical protein HII36_54400 [Nonomuraea sp. NN258]|uniref:hypothetical protein n=1 Tax=Nonomuraea antri TaxID=2730852 RepID=UPI00156A6ECA|nr:hypothetical protein [Nonomuraea antri]NRQ40743.1 hypothetical protein [Nonomuraea antri]